ncbi:hypothetical protein, partial [Paraburkholderia sp. EG304]|uniref:hypothetical protein n=1 Tax=Paraburkholderia sp. EG304 TaxID=3237015 RepID=UPI00397A1418
GNQPADISVTHRRDVLLRRPQEIQMYPDREPIAIDTESHISPSATFGHSTSSLRSPTISATAPAHMKRQLMDDQHVFSGFGIDILRRSGCYFLRYDAGELVVQIRELELSPEDALLATQSEQSAYEVILRLTSNDGERR